MASRDQGLAERIAQERRAAMQELIVRLAAERRRATPLSTLTRAPRP